MSNPYEPPSDPWADPSRALPPPEPVRDAAADAPYAPPQAPAPPIAYPPPAATPAYGSTASPASPAPTYPPPGQVPDFQLPPPQYQPSTVRQPPAAAYQQPSYAPPRYSATPPYVPTQPYPGTPGHVPPPPPGYPYSDQGWPPPAPPKHKSRVGLIIAIVAGVVVLCLAGVGTLVAIGLNKASQLARPAHVVAEVTGSGPTDITFTINSSVEDTGTRAVPYSITRDVPRDGNHLSLKAEPIAPGASATCRILVDGTVVASRTATGLNSQAACDAYV